VLGTVIALAAAAAPMPGQTYTGAHDFDLVVSRSGARVERMSFSYDRRCRGRKNVYSGGTAYLRKVRIRNGRFVKRDSRNFASTGGSFRLVIKGRFSADGTKVSGTLHEVTKNPQTRITCNSGTVRFSGAVPERELVNGDWAGQTAQGRPLALTITEDGVTKVTGEIALTCGNGEQIVRAIKPPSQPASLDNDLSFRAGELTGTATRSRVSGTVSAEDFIEREDRSYDCRSGEVAFSATPAPAAPS